MAFNLLAMAFNLRAMGCNDQGRRAHTDFDGFRYPPDQFEHGSAQRKTASKREVPKAGHHAQDSHMSWQGVLGLNHRSWETR